MEGKNERINRRLVIQRTNSAIQGKRQRGLYRREIESAVVSP